MSRRLTLSGLIQSVHVHVFQLVDVVIIIRVKVADILSTETKGDMRVVSTLGIKQYAILKPSEKLNSWTVPFVFEAILGEGIC